ncbi:MAG: ABC transporter substrate-binding protein [Candidatus Methanoperedens sp.]|nr:ABC transporter substrate-binding protein [Candidatus Methanoperedens sp. BLZ2]KAB2940883.1 MAG: ABC transporter substrate-binding protein [Candidatus Methanoperedens sp.]MBZ0177238.1 ABC transporter substrate-binding protein [Candidatus Methanoperedens nitroreducens]MCX9077149.1 ABC transporter substrate-binding protein [Candidatus Methanoperedens sp.]MCX9089822.1 ABC transporter substrate-binding protein [Candidatus Methanoperedens sp.]
MNNKIKILGAVIVIAMIALAGCLTGEKISQKGNLTNEKENVVTIRYLSSSAVVEPYEFASELGYLTGINISRLGTNTGGPEDIMSVATGSTDVGHSAWVSIINAKVRGAQIQAVAGPMGNSPEGWYEGTPYLSRWIVLENSTIRSAKDLKGKKIAVHTLGAHAEYVTREYLSRNNMSKDDVELLVMSHQEEVLRQGLVDVVAPVGAQIDRMEAGGGVRVLFTDYDIIGNQTHCGMFMSEKFIKENPRAVKLFVEGSAKAADWAKDHPEEARELAAEIMKDKGGNPDMAKYWKGFGVREHALLQDSDVQFWIDWLVKDGRISEGQYKPSDFYTNEYNPYFKG